MLNHWFKITGILVISIISSRCHSQCVTAELAVLPTDIIHNTHPDKYKGPDGKEKKSNTSFIQAQAEIVFNVLAPVLKSVTGYYGEWYAQATGVNSEGLATGYLEISLQPYECDQNSQLRKTVGNSTVDLRVWLNSFDPEQILSEEKYNMPGTDLIDGKMVYLVKKPINQTAFKGCSLYFPGTNKMEYAPGEAQVIIAKPGYPLFKNLTVKQLLGIIHNKAYARDNGTFVVSQNWRTKKTEADFLSAVDSFIAKKPDYILNKPAFTRYYYHEQGVEDFLSISELLDYPWQGASQWVTIHPDYMEKNQPTTSLQYMYFSWNFNFTPNIPNGVNILTAFKSAFPADKLRSLLQDKRDSAFVFREVQLISEAESQPAVIPSGNCNASNTELLATTLTVQKTLRKNVSSSNPPGIQQVGEAVKNLNEISGIVIPVIKSTQGFIGNLDEVNIGKSEAGTTYGWSIYLPHQSCNKGGGVHGADETGLWPEVQVNSISTVADEYTYELQPFEPGYEDGKNNTRTHKLHNSNIYILPPKNDTYGKNEWYVRCGKEGNTYLVTKKTEPLFNPVSVADVLAMEKERLGAFKNMQVASSSSIAGETWEAFLKRGDIKLDELKQNLSAADYKEMVTTLKKTYEDQKKEASTSTETDTWQTAVDNIDACVKNLTPQQLAKPCIVLGALNISFNKNDWQSLAGSLINEPSCGYSYVQFNRAYFKDGMQNAAPHFITIGLRSQDNDARCMRAVKKVLDNLDFKQLIALLK